MRYSTSRTSKKQGESSFSNKLKIELRKAFPRSKWWKNHGTEFSERGLSDLSGVISGRFYAIEVKVNNGWFTPLQIKYLNDINLAGGTGIGLLRKDDEVYLVPTSAMGTKGNRHRELWQKIKYPAEITMIEFFGDYE